jgi:hypothetical protein
MQMRTTLNLDDGLLERAREPRSFTPAWRR